MKKSAFIVILLQVLAGSAFAMQTNIPDILIDDQVKQAHFLPDFSYAGYQFGERKIPSEYDHSINVVDFGAKPNDALDDSDAFINALKHANTLDGYVVVKIPEGKFIINKIIYINRSKTILKGVGSGASGSIIYFQRPLRFVPDPPEHEELKEYLVRFDKRAVNAKIGLDSLFSQYSWSGGFIWVAKKGKFYKSYNIPEYNQPINAFANVLSGKQGGFELEVNDTSNLKVGQTYKLAWFNRDGKEGSLLKHMYNNQDLEIGEHHWNNPNNPLVTQMVMITKIDNNSVKVKAPLLYDVKPQWTPTIVEWEHIEEVGIENISFEFPQSADFPHHLEQGFNAIYLTSLMNGWVSNVSIKDADSGILTDDISNVTIKNILTHGDKKAHYSVAMGEVHNVLVDNLRVQNDVVHTISFNTRSTRSVYTNSVLEGTPILDQHSGTNAQNLFDNITFNIDAPVHRTHKYKLFVTGGSPRWYPGHGAYNTLYNLDVNFANLPEKKDKAILLYGTQNGASARLIGIRANHPVEIDYSTNPYIEKTNEPLSVQSLYEYQLNKRLDQ